jgi:hypothetical protein
MLKIGVTKIPNGSPPHPKYSFSRTTCFVLHQKTLFLEIGTIHQFAYGVDQFYIF